ncbi:MAG TPA: glycosyl transferase [Ramlibacter sp.]|jgi:hypothetical protein|uniref:glycosyl transferase n=1 Tax=Ramlibacter sp. TaxID=1917967 RepID=UPI002D5F765C|nr:glycosyl transferase [Ramlibacter sp.]HZY20335.1 glycosyl transferase [Ramlibacter sp.]
MPFDSRRPRAAFTICARNYMAQALVLRRSFLQHHPDHDFFIVVVDRRDPAFAACHVKAGLVWAEDLGLPGFARHALRFDVIELSTNVKAHCLALLLQRHERVLYLDPDTWVLDSLDPVYASLDDATLVVTPASLSPVLDGHRPDDIEFLRVGVFNLGFIGFRACDEARRVLQWWSDRCLREGFHETQSGVFVDQKWMNLAPCYFEGVRILKDPGVNMAPWNLHERQLVAADGGWTVNGGGRLRLFHFSSFDPHRPQTIAKRQTRYAEGERTDLAALLEAYARAVRGAGYDALSRLPYGFDYFPDGHYVSPTLRRLYASPLHDFPADEDPFEPGSRLRAFAQRHRLMGPKVRPAERLVAVDMARFGRQARILRALFRLALQVLGPNRYFTLMRWLAHASSIRLHPPL